MILHRLLQLKSISAGFLILLCSIALNAQPDSKTAIYYGAELLPGYSSMTITPASGNFNTYSDKRNFQLNFGLNGQYYLNTTYGIETGIYLLTHDLHLSKGSDTSSFNTTDSEGDPYLRIVYGNNISETSTLRTINIPVHITYRYPISKSTSLFISLGPGIGIPVEKKVNAQGTFTYWGYYANLNDTLRIPPRYGFNSNVPVSVNESLQTNPVFVFGSVSLGLLFNLSKQYQLFLGGSYYTALTSILKNNGSYHVSNDLGSYNSFFYNLKNPVDAISISIGFRILLENDD